MSDAPFTVRIGDVSPALAVAHKRHRVDSSAYITAVNPFSQAVDDAANTERHAALSRELERRSLSRVEGVGQPPSDEWPGEASNLIFGQTLEAAKTLGTLVVLAANAKQGVNPAAPRVAMSHRKVLRVAIVFAFWALPCSNMVVFQHVSNVHFILNTSVWRLLPPAARIV